MKLKRLITACFFLATLQISAAFEIRDLLGRVDPSQAKRLAPDFHFHPQVYRNDGESVKLPAGHYRVRSTRGPE